MALSGGFQAGWEPCVAVEEVAESIEFADAPFGRGGWVGVGHREVGEPLEGAPASFGTALLHLPRSRSDRSRLVFACGLSDEGGRDDVDESRRAWRSSCSTLAVSSPISRYASASRAASSAAGSTESSSEGTPGASGTPANGHHRARAVNNPARRCRSQQARPVTFSAGWRRIFALAGVHTMPVTRDCRAAPGSR
jgi:hypothetical protein